jgi:hypothetical protein
MPLDSSLEAEGYNKMANTMSEDALFKALLKNKPPQKQTPKPPAAPQPAPIKETFKASAPPAEIHEMETPVIETRPVKSSHDTDQVVESIKNLTSSVNMMYGLMKTVITPVLVLILIIGIAILVKG